MDTIRKQKPVAEILRKVVEQAFIPIFVVDGRDVAIQLAACREAGLGIIEYTQRRGDSAEKIPEILKNDPGVMILAGSTLDDDGIVCSLRRHHPQLRTFGELAAMGVSGFVSRLGFSEATCRRWKDEKLLIPCAGTVNEAYRLFAAGAHIIKIVKPDYEVVRQLGTTPTFGFCPLFVTGGMLPETIPGAMQDGVLCVGTGFDAIMKGQEKLSDAEYHDELVKRLCALRRCTVESREKRFPGLTAALERGDWTDMLPFAFPGGLHA